MGGKLACSFAALIKEMWAGSDGRTAPSDLKRTLGSKIARFSGYGQQDSGELVNYLVDLLSEDLNRVVDKQYSEYSEEEGRSDEVIAAEYWSNMQGRNNSIINDLMTGQTKSTVTCLTCGFISITFDPMSSVIAPIPQRLIIDVLHVPYVPVEKDEEDEMKCVRMPYLDIEISDSTTALDLKQKYATRLNVDINDLFMAIKVNDQVKKHLGDNYKLSDIDPKGFFTMIYHVPPPMAVENPVEPMIKDGEAEITKDELVEFMFYVDTDG